jgi:hypothetical protein
VITLRKHHKVRQSRNIGTCGINCSTLRGTQSEQCHETHRKNLTSEPFKAIQSPVLSDQEVQLGVLTITAIITAADDEAAVQEAVNANSKMQFTPNDPIDQLQPALAIEDAVVNKSGLLSVLERLDGFMRLANLAAEVRYCSVSALQPHS